MTIRRYGKRKTERAIEAYGGLLRASAAVTALQGQQLAAFGLTPPQFGVLRTLLTEGPLSVTQAGARMGCTDSNASVVASKLEERGLIARWAGERDRRRVMVHLTPQGRALASRVFPQYAKLVRAQMSALSAAQQETLKRLCRRLEEGDVATFAVEMTLADGEFAGER